MKISKSMGLVVLAGFAALLSSCGSGEYLVKDPNVMLSYMKEPTTESLDNLAKAYSSTINKNRRSNTSLPGLFADYGVALAQQGRAAEANVWFNKEMDMYPASRPYVMQLKRQLVPQFLNDTSSTFMSDTLNIYQADELNPQRRAAAEERAATVLEESDRQIETAAPDQTENPDGAVEESDEAPVEESVKVLFEESEVVPVEEQQAADDDGQIEESIVEEPVTE